MNDTHGETKRTQPRQVRAQANLDGIYNIDIGRFKQRTRDKPVGLGVTWYRVVGFDIEEVLNEDEEGEGEDDSNDWLGPAIRTPWRGLIRVAHCNVAIHTEGHSQPVRCSDEAIAEREKHIVDIHLPRKGDFPLKECWVFNVPNIKRQPYDQITDVCDCQPN